MSTYAAKYACQYNGRIFKPDERLKFTGEVAICPDCKGKKGSNGTSEVTSVDKNEFTIMGKSTVCKLCKDSGRIDPPHHFVKLGDDHAKEEKEGEEVLTEEKKQPVETSKLPSRHVPVTDEMRKLRAEITRLGGSYSGRWDVERLTHELIVTQKKYGEKNAVTPAPEV